MSNYNEEIINNEDDFFNNLIVDIKSTDMDEELIKFCVSITLQSLENYNYILKEKENEDDNIEKKEITVPNYFSYLSESIKNELDKCYKPPWNVIVGENYGSFFTHKENNFVILKINTIWLTIFKTA